MQFCKHSKDRVEEVLREFYAGHLDIVAVASALDMTIIQLAACLDQMGLLNEDVRSEIELAVDQIYEYIRFELQNE